jgi:hypothetical protein
LEPDHSRLTCQYSGQNTKSSSKLRVQTFLCDQSHTEAAEYEPYSRVKKGDASAIIPSFRHWLNHTLSDPVSAFTLILAVSTIGLWFSTRRLWQGAEAQARDFKLSIAAAGRSAVAMESVAASLAVNAEEIVKTVKTVKTNREIADRQKVFGEMQYRPYVSVLLGTAHYQDVATNYMFAALPRFANSGATPARDVRFRASAAVLPFPLPRDIKLWLPPQEPGRNLIAPHTESTPTIVTKQLFAPEEIRPIMFRNDGRCLYVWGVVTYRDSFKNMYRTTFLHQMHWHMKPDGELIVTGMYLGQHNRAN